MVGNTTGEISSKIYIIIVAAGMGNRFGSNIPKQFVSLAGKPVLMRTIESFSEIGKDSEIVIVLNKDDISLWNDLCRLHGFVSPAVVFGGATRTESVRNALNYLKLDSANPSDIVLIHDGARPLVEKATIDAVISKLKEKDVCAAIPYTAITDSLMTAEKDNSTAVDRSGFVAVQTPQGFSATSLVTAYNQLPADDSMTDDASVVSKYARAKIHLVEGSRTNIKITYPQDIKIAELFLNDQS